MNEQIDEILTKLYLAGMAAKEKEFEAMTTNGARAYIHRPIKAVIAEPGAKLQRLMVEAKIDTAKHLNAKSIKYDTHDPIMDKDNWATPNSYINYYIEQLTKELEK